MRARVSLRRGEGSSSQCGDASSGEVAREESLSPTVAIVARRPAKPLITWRISMGRIREQPSGLKRGQQASTLTAEGRPVCTAVAQSAPAASRFCCRAETDGLAPCAHAFWAIGHTRTMRGRKGCSCSLEPGSRSCEHHITPLSEIKRWSFAEGFTEELCRVSDAHRARGIACTARYATPTVSVTGSSLSGRNGILRYDN